MKVLVTGASSGIGYELVKQLCEKQHTVYATGRNLAKLTELSAQTGCRFGSFDLSDPQQLADMYNHAIAELEGIDVLINNAGMNARKCTVEEFDVAELDASYALNLKAPVLLSQLAFSTMKAQQSGYIFNVTSTVIKRSSETMSVYTAMKQGLAGFTGVLMKEAQPHGIKVTNLVLGGTDTAFRPADRPEYMHPSSVASSIVGLLSLPKDVVMHEMVIRPPVEVE
jgi:short-subunit dehydrogenase